MAKSLRSKRKRKIRAEKRNINAKKELVKLQQVVSKLHKSKGALSQEELESVLPDVQLIEDPMLVDDNNGSSNAASKKQKPQINNQWMNQRKIKSLKKRIKKHNKKATRRGGVSSRRVTKSLKK